MKPILAVLLALSVVAVAQTRSDVFDGSKAVITEITLGPLPDGGCWAQWGATLTSEDGGVTISTVTPRIELKGALARGRCAGLAGQGANRVLKAFRLGDDGGVP